MQMMGFMAPQSYIKRDVGEEIPSGRKSSCCSPVQNQSGCFRLPCRRRICGRLPEKATAFAKIMRCGISHRNCSVFPSCVQSKCSPLSELWSFLATFPFISSKSWNCTMPYKARCGPQGLVFTRCRGVASDTITKGCQRVKLECGERWGLLKGKRKKRKI